MSHNEYDNDLVQKEPVFSSDNLNSSLDVPNESINTLNLTKDSDKLKSKPKKVPKETSIALPNMILLGYQEGTSKKDLEIFINSKAKELMNVDVTHYNIIRKDGGYYWELQEGGSGHGVLSSIIDGLKDHDKITFKTSNKTVRVTRKQNQDHGLSAFFVNEDDNFEQSECVEYKDKMKPLSSKGVGLFVFGFIIALLGILSLLLSFSFKYGLLNRMADVKLSEIQGVVPYTQFNKMKEVMKLDGTYIDVLVYDKKTNSYLIKTGQEETPEEINVKSSENAKLALPQEIIDATSDVTAGKE